MKEFEHEVVKNIATLGADSNSEKRLTIIRWNGGSAVFDLRKWDAKTDRPLKGITLKPNEMRTLLGVVSEEAIKEVEKMNANS